jgi:hypothetical protein
MECDEATAKPELTLVANYLLCIELFAMDDGFELRKIRTASGAVVINSSPCRVPVDSDVG